MNKELMLMLYALGVVTMLYQFVYVSEIAKAIMWVTTAILFGSAYLGSTEDKKGVK